MRSTDNIDVNILRELTRDARISNVQLALKVSLSPSACLRRVQELERDGILIGYRAKVSPAHLGRTFVAYMMVGLSSQKKATHDEFEQAVAMSREVVECHNIAGNFEYLLRIEVLDIHSFKRFHREVLGNLPGVTVITTYVVMASPKDERD